MTSDKESDKEPMTPLFIYFAFVVPITLLIVTAIIYTLALSLGGHFHEICVLSFSMLFITSLSYLYYETIAKNPNVGWAPVLSKCPDNWSIENNKCVQNDLYDITDNTYNLHNVTHNCSDATHDLMNASICDKQQFAQKCDVYWGGITGENIKC
jgi:hypothetical protein